MRRQLFVVLIVALALRLPFLGQAFQGDDYYYLVGARHVQADPAHPWRAAYVFLGDPVDMRGHTHPPMNVWFLGAAVAVLGGVREVPLHATWLGFSLLAAASALVLARRFSPQPVLATLVFLASPAFVVSGNTLESDVPFTALGLAAVAAFVRALDTGRRRWLAAAAAALALAALTAYQAVLLCPILLAYAGWRRRGWRFGLAVAFTPLGVVAGFQLYQYLAGGSVPAAVLMGHIGALSLLSPRLKLHSGLALTAHLAWIVFPALSVLALGDIGRRGWIAAGGLATLAALVDPHPLFWASFGVGVAVLLACVRRLDNSDPDGAFLATWILIYFAGALAVFFAGAARYLLPLGLPLAASTVQRVAGRGPRLLVGGLLLQLALVSMPLAVVNYHHANAYREFVDALRPRLGTQPIWINGEWGLQYYGQQAGGRAILRDQSVRPGEWIVSSQLAYPVRFSTGGVALETVAERRLDSAIPLRIVGLSSRSGFSSTGFGIRPFDLSTRPLDLLRAERAVARLPTLSWLPMSAPEAESQIVSGVYGLEAGAWRWTDERAVLLLRRPAAPASVAVSFVVPDAAPGRTVTLSVDGVEVAARTCPGPGSYELVSAAVAGPGPSARVEIRVDRTFHAPSDRRRLGIVLVAAGFR